MDQDEQQTTQKASSFRQTAFGGGYEQDDKSSTLKSRDHKDATDLVVAHTLRGEGFDASEDGTGRGTPIVTAFNIHSQNSEAMKSPGPSKAAFQTTVARALDSQGFTSSQGGTVALGPTIAFPQNMSATQCASTEEVSPVLQEKNPTAICFSSKDRGADAGELAPTLRAGVHDKSHENGGCPPAVAFTERSRADGRNFECQEDVSYALTNPGSGGRTHSRQIATHSSVRRLTPTECERLQGFPDGYTVGQSDSARYRQLGNAVAVPVAAWIARRLMTVIKSEE